MAASRLNEDIKVLKIVGQRPKAVGRPPRRNGSILF